MKYLLDTCVLSDFVKGEKNTVKNLKSRSPDVIYISSITVMEIEYGLALNPKYVLNIKSVMDALLNTITILNFNTEDAKQTALIRADLKQKGTPVGSYAILLAGMALNRKLILATANMQEFNRVSNLRLENWREK